MILRTLRLDYTRDLTTVYLLPFRGFGLRFIFSWFFNLVCEKKVGFNAIDCEAWRVGERRFAFDNQVMAFSGEGIGFERGVET